MHNDVRLWDVVDFAPTFSFNGRLIWSLVLAVICWSLWKEQNSRVFEDLKCADGDVIFGKLKDSKLNLLCMHVMHQVCIEFY